MRNTGYFAQITPSLFYISIKATFMNNKITYIINVLLAMWPHIGPYKLDIYHLKALYRSLQT